VAARSACVNDLVAFSLNSTGTVTTFSWDFGGVGSSSNSAPLYKFTTAGKTLVSCTATLVGGNKCIDTHSIYILPSPKAALKFDSLSKFCLRNNSVCILNQSKLGSVGLQKATILWGDGNLNNFKQPFASKWCYKYSDTGKFTIHMEIADSSGCKDTVDLNLHIHPSVNVKLQDTVYPGCDSSLVCFNETLSGGTKFSQSWRVLQGKYSGKGKLPFCTYVKGGQILSIRVTETNEFGCQDSSTATRISPDSSIAFNGFNKYYCLANIKSGGVILKSKYDVKWELNGKSYYTSTSFSANDAKPGWNYVRITKSPPCGGTAFDSFFVTNFNVKARLFNDFRRINIDTAIFQDLSKNVAGSRIFRMWYFNDLAAPPCTTWTQKNQNIFSNCNFSRDSIARHFYLNADCYQARLHLYDSTTGCAADTTINLYRKEYCTPVVIKKKVCLGDFELFNISEGLNKKLKGRQYLLTDDKLPRDSMVLGKGSTVYYYTTAGYKSPIFVRYFDPDTVWAVKNGKVVIDYIRPAKEWVRDTFKNAVFVTYKPNAKFKLTKISNCNPSKVKLNFEDTFFRYPFKIIISWGDSVQTITGFTDSIVKLPILQHTYPSAGKYVVYVNLITTKGECPSEFSIPIIFGQDSRFRAFSGCNGKVIFDDSVIQDDPIKLWNQNSGDGKLYWDFGDGSSTEGFGPSHVYKTAGSYSVRLISVSNKGCSDTFTAKVDVVKPIAVIRKPPLVYCSDIQQYYDSSFMQGTSGKQYILRWNWNFGDGTPNVFVQNPAHIYAVGGVYTIRLIVETDRYCRDTTYTIIDVMGPQVKCDFDSDSIGCATLVVKFKNQSKKTGNFIWEFGDPNNTFYSTNKDTGVAFAYRKAGVYYAHLTGGDSFTNPNTGSKYFCSVRYPAPGQKQLRITVYSGGHSAFSAPDTLCLGDTFQIVNSSDVSISKYNWDMGDGITFQKPVDTFTYSYSKTGKYKVSLHAVMPVGNLPKCYDTALKTIVVLKPGTGFEVDCGRSNSPEFYLKNTSASNNSNYRWTLLNPIDSTETFIAKRRDLLWDFQQDTGYKIVCLRLDAGPYCRSKNCQRINLFRSLTLANVFTPGTDGYNDTYKVPLYGYEDFELRIFNRWGERLFITQNPYFEWNGRVNNTGLELPAATYFYQVQFRKTCDRKLAQVNGSINLIR
jgi:gliding motility-associated-like protein